MHGHAGTHVYMHVYEHVHGHASSHVYGYLYICRACLAGTQTHSTEWEGRSHAEEVAQVAQFLGYLATELVRMKNAAQQSKESAALYMQKQAVRPGRSLC